MIYRYIMEERIECFEPAAAEDARLLILGTMPSVESLRQSFYYSHPRNAFWPIIAQVLNEPVPIGIEEKRDLLIRHRIALWDVCGSCVRPGSLDSNIRDVQPNDFEMLFRRCTGIRKILFNGAMAEKLYAQRVGIVPQGCICERMPSTSPAYTMRFEAKLAVWRSGMEDCYD